MWKQKKKQESPWKGKWAQQRVGDRPESLFLSKIGKMYFSEGRKEIAVKRGWFILGLVIYKTKAGLCIR